MRLAKFLAHAGVASRRGAEQLVFGGRVTVDGDVVRDPARDVAQDARVALDGEPVRIGTRHVVHALNKPAGVVSTARDTHGRTTVVDLVPSPARLYPVGRLDADSTGLILLTNDGDLAYRLTHPRFEVARTYVATVRRAPVREGALRALREGVDLDDGRTAPARVRRLAPDRLEIALHEGRKRQVRRMCEAVGHPVSALERVAFGPLTLGRLAPGDHRRLTAAEVEALRRATRAEAAAGAHGDSHAPPRAGSARGGFASGPSGRGGSAGLSGLGGPGRGPAGRGPTGRGGSARGRSERGPSRGGRSARGPSGRGQR